jgi:hypothetical protein
MNRPRILVLPEIKALRLLPGGFFGLEKNVLDDIII